MAKINLTKFYMDQIKTVFKLSEEEINNRVKHPISVTIGKTKRKYQIFNNVIATIRDEGELRIGYFNKNGDFRMYCSYPFVYQPEFMVMIMALPSSIIFLISIKIPSFSCRLAAEIQLIS